jgi:magnesium transporter
MGRSIRTKPKRAGLSPGTLIHTGEKKTDKARITIFDYDGDRCTASEVQSAEETFPFKDRPTNTWINIDGLHQVDLIEKIGQHYQLHPLLLEDIVSVRQRPKLDDYDNYLFIVLKMLRYDEGTGDIETEQVSLVLGKNFLISFQENVGDVFGPVRDRLRNAKGRIRTMGVDYLAYALIDAVVDEYFHVLEKIGGTIGDLEEQMLSDPRQETMTALHKLKRTMILLRKSVWPLRDVIGSLERGESSLICKETHVFLRDVYDHTIQEIDTIESYRDMLSGLLEVYLSTISNRLNAVMKVLTIIATIFMPLSFITGLYGMNFDHMPELHWHWGYPAVLVLMVLVTIAMLFFFKKKNWL